MSSRRKYPGSAPTSDPAPQPPNFSNLHISEPTNGLQLAGTMSHVPVSEIAPSVSNTMIQDPLQQRMPAATGVPSTGGGFGPSFTPNQNIPSDFSQVYQNEAPNMAPYMPEQVGLQCPPEFLRMTHGVIPNTQELYNKTSIPIGAIFHPLAETCPTPVRRFFIKNFS